MTRSQPEGYRPSSQGRTVRLLTKVLLTALPIVGVFFIMDTPTYLGWEVLREQYYGIVLAIVLSSVFLLTPANRGSARGRVPWYDVFLALMGFAVGLYVAVLYPQILWRLGVVTPDRVILSTIAIVLILEAARRLTGWVLPILGLLFILYGRFAWLAPGVLEGPGIPWDRLANSLYLDPNAVLGTPMEVASVIVIAYILFGNLLSGVGGGEFITNLAVAGFGRFRGGPAKIAVASSSLFGTISGSAVANVMVDGWITIPLMKKTGYRPHVAGAIEAVASTGGQIMPPVMGAAAFLIPEYTGIPYAKVAIGALFPALLYYICMFIQIDLEAGKTGLKGLTRDQLPPLKGVLGESYLFILPLAALVYALFILFLSPGKAALFAVASILILSLFRRQTRFRFFWILDELEKTGKGLLELTVVVAVAGIIIGIITFSGLGFILPVLLGRLAEGSVILLLVVMAVANIILGMGMPTIAVYVLLAVIMAPSLIQLGIDVLAAHLFILYYGILSMITPPVCFAAFAGAAIAGASSMRTGYACMRLGILAYIVPFLFIFSPSLLLMGSLTGIVLSAATAIAGCFLLGCALVGYLFRDLGALVRVLMGLAGIGLLIPIQSQYFTATVLINIAGGILALALFLAEYRYRIQPAAARKVDAEA
ncbi:MAG: TRAP transporter fused permease subunit [Thermodesulfobacteriota bacterium]